jgi:xanthine dehydrogenase/oxidase
LINHLSHASGIPADTFRERNFYKNGDKTHYGQTIENFYIPGIWKQLLQVATIAERRREIESFNLANKWKKRGLSVLPVKFGIGFSFPTFNQAGALVHVYQDGTVLVTHGGVEMGQGLHTKLIQIAAKAFDIPDNLVYIAETATNIVANSIQSAGSMSTDLFGMAVLDACEQLRERLKPVKSSLPAEARWADIVQTAFFLRIDLTAHGFYVIDLARCSGYDWNKTSAENAASGPAFNYFTQGVAASEVEVDCLTGDTNVLRADIVMDLGKSINPGVDIGQIEGAFMQGFGWSTMEELVRGDKDHPWVPTGQLATRGPGSYKIPSFNDVPKDFRVHLSDTNNLFAIHSSKAVGEPPIFLGCTPFFAIKVT